ncbi:MAG: hypothetical protein ACM33V_14540 [Chloroflexota bacterium]|nr:hypothetical protein [Anaerolineales bacterium]
MRKLIIIFLALVLVACSAPPAPTQAPTEPPAPVLPEDTQTAVVVVITATSAPTDEPTATAQPTYTPLPTYTMPPAATEAPVQPAATEAVAPAPTQAAAGGDIAVDDKLGKGWFTNMTRSRNDFSLRCQINKEITFKVKVTNDKIKSVDMWYRFEDRATGAVFEWTNLGKMVPDLEGSYSITITGEQTNPNFRKPNSYFDYQFVAYNPTGVMGRSEKIERQVTFTFDCP